MQTKINVKLMCKKQTMLESLNLCLCITEMESEKMATKHDKFGFNKAQVYVSRNLHNKFTLPILTL